jgi:hypothetical protein
MASTTFDLPEPLGPTTQVIPGSSFIVVEVAKDLKPFTVRLLRYTELRSNQASGVYSECTSKWLFIAAIYLAQTGGKKKRAAAVRRARRVVGGP